MTFLMNQISQLIQLAKKKSEEEPYYEVLEKITLTGVEYFDLGYKLSDFAIGDTIRFEGIIKGTDASTIPSSGSQLIFSLGNDGGQWLGKAQNGIKYAFGTPNQSTIDFNEEVLADVTITLSGNLSKPTFAINGSVTSDTETSTIPQRTATPVYYNFPLLFGAGTRSTGEKAYGGDYTIKCGKIYINGIMTKDYIPVLDDKMQPCLYDKISKTFTYAKKISDDTDATSTLTYKRWNKYNVDYLQSDGSAYIPLSDITPTTTMGINIEYAYTALSPSEPAGVFGTYNGDTQRKDTFFVSTSSGYTEKATSPSTATCGIMVFHRGQNAGTSTSTSENYVEPETNVWYTATVNWLNDGEITWTNGIKSLSNICGTNTILTNELRAFGRCRSSDSTYNYSKSRIRKLQISDGSKIIRSFIPSVYIYTSGSTFVAKAFFYDEIYNKAYSSAGTGSLKAYIIGYGNVFTRTGETTGKYIDDNGDIQTNSNSAYSALLPIKGGETVTCASGTAIGNNYRYHVYDSNGTWIEQALVLNPPTTTAITGSFVAPANASYVRVSYANGSGSNSIQVNSNYANYEVGKSVSGTPSSTVSGVSNCFDTGLYGTQNTTVKHIAIGYDSNSTAGQLFGSYDGNTTTSKNLTINSSGTGSTAPIRFDGQTTTKVIQIPINTFASIVTNKYGIWVNNALHDNWGDVNDFTTLTTMLILKCNNSNNVRNNGCGYCLILEKGVPVAEYIPVRNANNTSVYGLYDKVSKTLNTGEGTINFNVLD